MRKNCKFLGLVYGLSLLISTSLQAQETIMAINGFASAGFITGDLDAPLYSERDIISESATFGADNGVGLQIFSEVNDKVSFTGQLLAKGLVDGYSLDAHWAFIDYHPRHDLSFRAGRLVLPVMMVSEFVDVGYAYPWARPPTEAYSGVPFASYSGIDVIYTLNVGHNNLIIQPYLGSIPSSSSTGGDLRADLGVGLNLAYQFEYGFLRAHVMQVEGLAGTSSSSGLTLQLDAQIIAIGADVEFGNVVVISEYIKKDFELTGLEPYSEVGGEAAYLTLGYRMGKFLPHITFASADSDVEQASALDVALEQVMADPAFLAYMGTLSPAEQQALVADPIAALSDPAVQAGLVGAGIVTPSELQAFPSLVGMLLPPPPLAYKQTSITLGLRYEMLSNTALKLEYQEIEPQEESWGLFVSEPADKVKLASFVIDVTF